MKEFNKMEKSIYEIMEGFEVTPSVGQKDIFLKNVLEKKAAQKRKKLGFIFIAGFSCLVALSSIFFMNHEKSATIKSNIASQVTSNAANPSSITRNETTEVNPVQNTISDKQSIEKESIKNSSEKQSIPNSVVSKQIIQQNEIPTNQNISSSWNQPIVNSTIQSDKNTIIEQNPINTDTIENIIVVSKEENDPYIPVISLNQNQSEIGAQTQDHLDTNKSEVPINEPNKTKKSSAFNRVFIQELETSVGIYYRPEVIFNIIENDKYIHNFGIEFKFHPFNPRYEIRTGFGLSVSKGYYEYQVDYNQYLGSYNSLDSVSFTVADNGFNLVPEYHFSNADVYNDYLSTYYTKIYRQHIYLQIPLEMGYDFVKTKKNAIGFRVGPTLSILMNQKPINLQYNAGKDKVVQINRITPDRISANWQLMGGFNFAHYLGHFIFEIEPRITYYFNSVYEKNDLSSSPYSVNLRLAIGYK
jgi:hypothetical protein